MFLIIFSFSLKILANTFSTVNSSVFLLQDSTTHIGQKEIVLNSDDPRMETAGREFFLLVYLVKYFDMARFVKDVVLN